MTFYPRDVACPLCGAKKGRRCRDLINGGMRSDQRGSHYERVQAAMKDAESRAAAPPTERKR